MARSDPFNEAAEIPRGGINVQEFMYSDCDFHPGGYAERLASQNLVGLQDKWR
jgi:hypothetical protein